MPQSRSRPEPEPDRPAVPDTSWEALYDELGEKVFRLLHRMTRSPELAADLTHDTFVRAFERLEQFDRRGALAGWVYRIATNLARDHMKRPHPFAPEPARERAPAAAGHGSGEPDLRLLLRAALDALPEPNRVVVLLHEVDGFTHEEIGRMLEIAPGTSKARLSRGRAMLREALGREA